MPTLDNAIILAVNAHKGQKDKGGDSYILHPLRLMHQMKTETEMMVAVLHDVIEDTSHSLEDLRNNGYTQEILEALDCLTKQGNESYDAFIERVKKNPIALKVKIADLEDNMDIKRLTNIAVNDIERLRKYLRIWQSLKKES